MRHTSRRTTTRAPRRAHTRHVLHAHTRARTLACAQIDVCDGMQFGNTLFSTSLNNAWYDQRDVWPSKKRNVGNPPLPHGWPSSVSPRFSMK